MFHNMMLEHETRKPLHHCGHGWLQFGIHHPSDRSSVVHLSHTEDQPRDRSPSPSSPWLQRRNREQPTYPAWATGRAHRSTPAQKKPWAQRAKGLLYKPMICDTRLASKSLYCAAKRSTWDPKTAAPHSSSAPGRPPTGQRSLGPQEAVGSGSANALFMDS